MPVGIVLVCHSATLARGAVELATAMTGDAVPIAPAAGLDDPEQPLGTDPMRVFAAIEEVWSPDGVLVLMDLGSAVLSAEFALDLLDPSRRAVVRLCAAPLVEGLVAAAVLAASGAPLDAVVREALDGLAAKSSHLETESGPATAVSAAGGFTVRLAMPHGMHARPAAEVVRALGGLDADVTVQNATTGRGPVPADSLNALLTLGARHNHDLTFHATGPEADAALDALQTLAAANFGDPAGTPADATRASLIAPDNARIADGPVLRGLPGAPGVGVGAVHRLDRRPSVPDEPPGPPDVELGRLTSARTVASDRLAEAARSSEPSVAAMLDAQRLMLDDPMLVDRAEAIIQAGRAGAAGAWRQAVAEVVAEYQALDDEYLAARAADVAALADEVVTQLSGGTHAEPPHGVVTADDLSPATTATLDPGAVTAIVTAAGSPSSHAALIARALGIPAVVGAGPAVLAIPDGTTVVVDGDAGTVDQDEAAIAAARRAPSTDPEAKARAHEPAITTDGVHIEVLANVGSVADAERAAAEGADGIGLLRSEFLFLGRTTPPDADEQATVYRAIATAMGGRTVVLRTLDVGGDKPLPYVPVPDEANPYLGLRGIRLTLARPELLTTQLEAAQRAGNLRLMLPMVTGVDEVRQVRELAGHIRLGVMIETPALALKIESVLAEVDFVSIGTNDLTQYVTAAERGNPAVAALYDELDPAVLRLIADVCAAARRAGVPVAVCGAAAERADAVPLLLGFGVRELSVPPPLVPRVKQWVRAVSVADAADLAARALTEPSAAHVRALLSFASGAGGITAAWSR